MSLVLNPSGRTPTIALGRMFPDIIEHTTTGILHKIKFYCVCGKILFSC